MFGEVYEKNCCGNCIHYDGRYCTAMWNNLDPDYCNPSTDEREPDEYCDMWEWEGD